MITTCGQTPKIKFDQTKAWEYLKTQVEFGPRNPGSAGHTKCRDWIVEECKKYTDKVKLQPFTYHWSKTDSEIKMSNILAEVNVGSTKTVILLAHWDTRPSADQDDKESNRNKPILGANDGASGVAVLLEILRGFKTDPPNVNVLFLFTDGEDLGPSLDEMFLGAKHFALNAKANQYAWGILLDMIGDKDLSIPKEPYSIQYAGSLVERFYAHAAEMGESKTFPNRVQGYIFDDHLPLNDVGIPTMDLIDFTYPYWHTLQDTMDKCSAESLGKVGRVLESFVRKER